MKTYLVVANQTATGPDLNRTVTDLVSRGGSKFVLVVPATGPRDHATWTEGTAYGLAHRRLLDALDAFRAIGANVEGWVGDASPYQAIADALREHPVDEVILSTFHQGLSRWLKMDVASRIRSDFGIPVRVIESRRVDIVAESRR